MWAIRAGNQDEADRLFLDKSCLALCSIDLDNDASQLVPSRAAFTEAFDRAQIKSRHESVPISPGSFIASYMNCALEITSFIRARWIAHLGSARSPGPICFNP
jgi:hypothetical protein